MGRPGIESSLEGGRAIHTHGFHSSNSSVAAPRSNHNVAYASLYLLLILDSSSLHIL